MLSPPSAPHKPSACNQLLHNAVAKLSREVHPRLVLVLVLVFVFVVSGRRGLIVWHRLRLPPRAVQDPCEFEKRHVLHLPPWRWLVFVVIVIIVP